MYIDYLSRDPDHLFTKRAIGKAGGTGSWSAYLILLSSLFAVVFHFIAALIPIVSLLIYLDSGRTRGVLAVFSSVREKIIAYFPALEEFSKYVRISKHANVRQAIHRKDGVGSSERKSARFTRRAVWANFLQFLNVLGGDMSITGPGHTCWNYTDEYSSLSVNTWSGISWNSGIAGWAQV